jgi:hypothetical protein
MAVVPLRSRNPRELVPALIAAVLLGGGVAACALAVVLGIGVERKSAWNPYLVTITLLALLPAVVLVLRWRLLRRPAHLVVRDDALVFTYPWLLRAAFSVPRDAVRMAHVGNVAALFEGGWIPLPALAPEGADPNVALFFDEPIAGARVRRSGLGRIHRGEPVVGLVLAVEDPEIAERGLDPFMRQMTTYDAYVVGQNLEATGRPRRELRLAKVQTLLGLMMGTWAFVTLVRLFADWT